LTFYFDRCFGKRFPEALLKMQTPFKVEYHHSPTNKFPEEMEDDEWLRIVGANNGNVPTAVEIGGAALLALSC
jgi:hypothetical protein